MADAHRPDAAAHVAELQGRAVAVGLRPLAAQVIETPALTVALVTKLFGETAGIEVRTALAVFVDEPLIGKQRPLLGIERRQLAVGDVVGDRGEEVVGVGRAARDIDNRRAEVAEGLLQADGTGGLPPLAGTPPQAAQEPMAMTAAASAAARRIWSTMGSPATMQ